MSEPIRDRDPDSLLNLEEAASVLGVSSRTLRRWRETSTGPRTIMVGTSPRIRVRDLLEYIDAGGDSRALASGE